MFFFIVLAQGLVYFMTDALHVGTGTMRTFHDRYVPCGGGLLRTLCDQGVT